MRGVTREVASVWTVVGGVATSRGVSVLAGTGVALLTFQYEYPRLWVPAQWEG